VVDVVVGKSDGTADGGHPLDVYVRPTLEVVVVEASQHLRRTMGGEVGLALLDLPLSRVSTIALKSC
jgi:uncharacterized protein